MPFRDPFPQSTAPDSQPRRFQEIENQFGSSNSGLSIPVCPSSSIPAASTGMNGRLLIEDAGTSFSLVAYRTTGRIRISGTAF